MRSEQERVEAVKRRAAELKRQRGLRRGRIITGSAAAASLALIVGLARLMPEMIRGADGAGYADAGAAASIFGGGAGIGYVVIALIAFALGVCVTALGYHIRRMYREDREAEDGHGRTG